MKELKDICLGNIEFSNLGNDLTFDIWSTYDGRLIDKIYCKQVNTFELKSTLGEEELFGTYVALIKIECIDDSNNQRITMESGEIFIKVECFDINFEN